MALFLRGATQKYWNNSIPGMDPGDVCIRGLRNLTSKNDNDDNAWGDVISVWKITDSNTERVIAAMAAGKMRMQEFDYLLIDEAKLRAAAADFMQSPGDTKDQGANNNWHYDVRVESSRKLLTVAESLVGKAKRFQQEEVARAIKASINAGYIQLDPTDPLIKGLEVACRKFGI